MSRTLYYLIIGYFVFNSFESKAQIDFDPSVIILVPNEVETDKSTEKEISEFNKKLSEQLANEPNQDNELEEQLKGSSMNMEKVEEQWFFEVIQLNPKFLISEISLWGQYK